VAAPSYTEDLTDINLAESTTGWDAYGGGNDGLSAGADFAQQGTNCIDKQITGADKGHFYDNGTGITLGTGDHIFIWHFCATPGITDSIQNKGASVLVGSSSTAYCQYHVAGNDTYGAAGRVARCYVVDYTTRTTNTSPPYRTLTGTPGANPAVFGGGLVTTAAVKGVNLGIDAIRYGTGAYLTAGELISAGDASDNPCTFAGFNTQNDAISNRWGILTDIGGTYELQGRFVIGQDNTQTATLCRFKDDGVAIVFADTIHAAADFSQIIIDHASTVCIWDNISLSAGGTTNRGRITVNSNDPTFTVTGGAWNSLAATTLRSNSTLTSVAIRLCDAITQNSAEIDNCSISESFATAAVISNNPANITDCTFTSGGSGHAIEITTAGTYSFVGNQFSGYGADSTTDAAIYNNSGGAVTLNISGGGATPTVRNGTGASTTINNTVTFRVTNLPEGAEIRLFRSDNQNELAGVERINIDTPSNGTVDADPNNAGKYRFSYSHQETSLDIYVVVLDYASIFYRQDFNINNSQAEQQLLVSLIPDRQYLNPD